MLEYAFSWNSGTKFLLLVLGFKEISIENWIKRHTFKPLLPWTGISVATATISSDTWKVNVNNPRLNSIEIEGELLCHLCIISLEFSQNLMQANLLK
jgi:hypothetical protein